MTPITSLNQLDTRKTYAYVDYLSWQLQERVELIRGRIFKIAPAPNLKHQRITGELFFQMKSFLQKQACQVFIAPFDVRLTKGIYDTVVQPDICVVCDATKLDEQGCNGAPELVIEVLSPGNSRRERKEKFELKGVGN